MAETMGKTQNYQVNRELGAGDVGIAPGPGDVAIIYATFPDREAAMTVGRMLIERRLAGCVNVIPGMTAIYEWDGAIREDGEVVVIVKTTAGLVGAAFAAIKAGHSYANPALLEIDVRAGSPDYLAWVKGQVEGRA